MGSTKLQQDLQGTKLWVYLETGVAKVPTSANYQHYFRFYQDVKCRLIIMIPILSLLCKIDKVGNFVIQLHWQVNDELLVANFI